MELPIDIFNWLFDASIISEYDIKEKDAEKVILEQEASQLFEIGLKMPALLSRLQALKVFHILSDSNNYRALKTLKPIFHYQVLTQ